MPIIFHYRIYLGTVMVSAGGGGGGGEEVSSLKEETIDGCWARSWSLRNWQTILGLKKAHAVGSLGPGECGTHAWENGIG